MCGWVGVCVCGCDWGGADLPQQIVDIIVTGRILCTASAVFIGLGFCCLLFLIHVGTFICYMLYYLNCMFLVCFPGVLMHGINTSRAD